MAWKIKIKNKVVSFIDKQDADTQVRIKKTLGSLLDYLNIGIFPFAEMNIKKLHGKRKGYFRLKIGDLRIIFKLDIANQEIYIYGIDYRGNVYKH